MNIKRKIASQILDEGKKIKREETLFDPKGRVVQESHFGHNGKLESSIHSHYEGELLVKIEESSTKAETLTILFQHDSTGEVMQTKTVYADGSWEAENIIVENGIETIEKTDSEDEHRTKQVAQLDENGNPLKEDHYVGGMHFSSTDNKYDDHGNPISQKMHDLINDEVNGLLLSYEYDKQGKISEMVQKDLDGTVLNHVKYVSDGEKILEYIVSDMYADPPETHWIYTYDEKGNLERTIGKDFQENIFYDEFKVFNKNNDPVLITQFSKGEFDPITGVGSNSTKTIIEIEYEYFE